MFDQEFQEKMIKIAMEEANIAIKEKINLIGGILEKETTAQVLLSRKK